MTPGRRLFVAGMAFSVMVLAVRGAVLAKIWAWFVVPLGAPHISWLDACGLSLLMATVIYRDSSTTNDQEITVRRTFTRALVTCWVLGIGFTVAALIAWLR